MTWFERVLLMIYASVNYIVAAVTPPFASSRQDAFGG